MIVPACRINEVRIGFIGVGQPGQRRCRRRLCRVARAAQLEERLAFTVDEVVVALDRIQIGLPHIPAMVRAAPDIIGQEKLAPVGILHPERRRVGRRRPARIVVEIGPAGLIARELGAAVGLDRIAFIPVEGHGCRGAMPEHIADDIERPARALRYGDAAEAVLKDIVEDARVHRIAVGLDEVVAHTRDRVAVEVALAGRAGVHRKCVRAQVHAVKQSADGVVAENQPAAVIGRVDVDGAGLNVAGIIISVRPFRQEAPAVAVILELAIFDQQPVGGALHPDIGTDILERAARDPDITGGVHVNPLPLIELESQAAEGHPVATAEINGRITFGHVDVHIVGRGEIRTPDIKRRAAIPVVSAGDVMRGKREGPGMLPVQLRLRGHRIHPVDCAAVAVAPGNQPRHGGHAGMVIIPVAVAHPAALH